MVNAALLDRIEWPVPTERLVLRRPTVADTAATWSFRRLDAVSKWLTRAPSTIEEHRAQFEAPDSLAKTVIIERDGQVIGDLMAAVGDGWSQAEVAEQGRSTQADLGWALHPDFVGHGYATEAVHTLIRLCFEDLGLRRVVANCFADNEASWRLMERVGMRREAHFVGESLHRCGRWLDSYAYALLASEWVTHSP